MYVSGCSVAEELEIKLTLSAASAGRALSWLQQQVGASKGKQKLLINRYYDTPSADLNKHKAALRVRQANGEFIQTLKTQGVLVGAAYRRQEWEWPLTKPELDLDLLSETSLSLKASLKDLKPIFETNFTRRIVMLDDGDALIECAVDSGSVIVGERRRPLHEVEFELKAGKPDRLLVWAKRLAQACPVFLNLISKAEQGYYLAGIPSVPRAVAGGIEESVVEEFLQCLSAAWLTEQPLMIDKAVLQRLADRAKARDVIDVFAQVSRQLDEGVTVNQLLDQPALGQSQLALLS